MDPNRKLTTKIVYWNLTDKRIKLKNYTPNIAHKTIDNIQKYLMPEERNYWWKSNHILVSTTKLKANTNVIKKASSLHLTVLYATIQKRQEITTTMTVSN